MPAFETTWTYRNAWAGMTLLENDAEALCLSFPCGHHRPLEIHHGPWSRSRCLGVQKMMERSFAAVAAAAVDGVVVVVDADAQKDYSCETEEAYDG